MALDCFCSSRMGCFIQLRMYRTGLAPHDQNLELQDTLTNMGYTQHFDMEQLDKVDTNNKLQFAIYELSLFLLGFNTPTVYQPL